jgi:hypothetical protein
MSSTGNAEQCRRRLAANESAQAAAIRNANDCHPDLPRAMPQVRHSRMQQTFSFSKPLPTFTERLSGFGRIESISDNFGFDRSFK